MDTFEKLLLDINISHKNHNEKRTKLYNRYYSNFPIHPKLFIENINKADPPRMCEIDTNIVQKALDNGELKKLEVYVLWAWLRSSNYVRVTMKIMKMRNIVKKKEATNIMFVWCRNATTR